MKTLRSFALALLLLAFAGGACQAAAEFPDHAVRILVGFAPGGGADTVARLLARKLSEKWKQPVLVENHGGADGTIAEVMVTQAPADGYTIILVINNHTIAPSQTKLSYDPIAAFAPISLVASSPEVLAVTPSLGVKTAKEFIALLKSKPGQLNFGSSGTGTQPYLQMELFLHETGTSMVNISYKGSNLAQVALLGGEIQALFGSISNYVQLAKAGKVQILGVSSNTRAAVLPEVPTIAEAAGINYDNIGWYGVLAPAGTPAPIVAKLHDDIVAAAKTPELQKNFADQGFTTVASTPAEFDSIIRNEIKSWAELIKAIGAH